MEKFSLTWNSLKTNKIRQIYCVTVKTYVMKKNSNCFGNIGATNSWGKQLWLFHCLSWGEKVFFLQNSVLTKNILHVLLCLPLTPQVLPLFLKIQMFSLFSLHSIKLVIHLLQRTQSAMKEMYFSLASKWFGLDFSPGGRGGG